MTRRDFIKGMGVGDLLAALPSDVLDAPMTKAEIIDASGTFEKLVKQSNFDVDKMARILDEPNPLLEGLLELEAK